jgi:hypothetical protein
MLNKDRSNCVPPGIHPLSAEPELHCMRDPGYSSAYANIRPQPAQFIAAFGSDDPGRLDIAPGFFKELPAAMCALTSSLLSRQLTSTPQCGRDAREHRRAGDRGDRGEDPDQRRVRDAGVPRPVRPRAPGRVDARRGRAREGAARGLHGAEPAPARGLPGLAERELKGGMLYLVRLYHGIQSIMYVG